jgi:hypothetical protein
MYTRGGRHSMPREDCLVLAAEKERELPGSSPSRPAPQCGGTFVS